jgi:hypothetical protein
VACLKHDVAEAEDGEVARRRCEVSHARVAAPLLGQSGAPPPLHASPALWSLHRRRVGAARLPLCLWLLLRLRLLLLLRGVPATRRRRWTRSKLPQRLRWQPL